MSTIIFVTLLLFFFVSSSKGQGINVVIDEEYNHLPANATVQEKWMYYENLTKTATNSALDKFLPYVLRASTKMNITSQCTKDMLKLIVGLKKMKMWAFRFIDSSAKGFDGTGFGAMSSFGSFDECIETVVPNDAVDKEEVPFRGQYCSIDLKPTLPPKPKVYKSTDSLHELENLFEKGTIWWNIANKGAFLYFQSMRVGICVPSTCTFEDVNQAVQMLGTSFSFEMQASRCEVKEEIKVTTTQIYVLCIYSFTATLLIIGTAIDTFLHYREAKLSGRMISFFLAFSLLKNFRRITSRKCNEGRLKFLNGIRFLSMTWVILGHTNGITNYRLIFDISKAKAHAGSFAYQAVVNGYFAVDTFFCMGGFLISYLTIKFVKIEGHPFNIGLSIFRRLWRLVPVYFFVIIFSFLGPWIGSGPLWKETVNEEIKNCYDNWWTNLLFINNFYNPKHMCIRQSWYLACDFQMFIFALLISVVLLRSSGFGVSLAALAVLGSIFYSGFLTYILDYPPTPLSVHIDKDYGKEYRANFFYQPFAHVAPYFIGYLTGYILAIKPNIKLSIAAQVSGWILAFVCNFSVLYSPQPWNAGKDPTVWETLMYASLSRSAWGFGVAWLIFACYTGHGGFVNYILSWDIFAPLSRLTFLAYLVHPLVITYFIGSIRTLIQADYFIMVWLYFGHLFASYAIAFAGSMLLESPFSALDKVLLKGPSRRGTHDANEDSSNNSSKRNTGHVEDGHFQVKLTSCEKTDYGRNNLGFLH